MNPFRRLACHVAPIIVALGISYVLISLFGDRYHPREVLDLHIEPAIVRPGETASVVFTAIDDRRCFGVVRRFVVDARGRHFQLPDSPAFYNDTLTRGTQFTYAREFAVPTNIAPGIAIYHSQTVRWCNVFQQYVWPMTDNYRTTFTVVGD